MLVLCGCLYVCILMWTSIHLCMQIFFAGMKTEIEKQVGQKDVNNC